jgi:hypothetical protein
MGLPKLIAATGWVPVHPERGTDWCALTLQEERPTYRVGIIPGWRWQRCILRIDDSDRLVDQ